MEIVFMRAKLELASIWNIKTKSFNGKTIESVWDVFDEFREFTGLNFRFQNGMRQDELLVAITQDKINKVLAKLETDEKFTDKGSLSIALRKISRPA